MWSIRCSSAAHKWRALRIGLIETVDAKLHEFEAKREDPVEAFLAAYPRLCAEAAGRLRTLYNPLDYPP